MDIKDFIGNLDDGIQLKSVKSLNMVNTDVLFITVPARTRTSSIRSIQRGLSKLLGHNRIVILTEDADLKVVSQSETLDEWGRTESVYL